MYRVAPEIMIRTLALSLAWLLLLTAVRVPLCEHMALLDVHWGELEAEAHCHAPGAPQADHSHEPGEVEHPACPGDDCCDEVPDKVVDALASSLAELADEGKPALIVAVSDVDDLSLQTRRLFPAYSPRPPPDDLPDRAHARAQLQVYTI